MFFSNHPCGTDQGKATSNRIDIQSRVVSASHDLCSDPGLNLRDQVSKIRTDFKYAFRYWFIIYMFVVCFVSAGDFVSEMTVGGVTSEQISEGYCLDLYNKTLAISVSKYPNDQMRYYQIN